MYMVELETRNFSFMTFDGTQRGALDLMVKTWRKHCEQYDIQAFGDGAVWPNEKALKDDCARLKVKRGLGFRDGQQILEM